MTASRANSDCGWGKYQCTPFGLMPNTGTFCFDLRFLQKAISATAAASSPRGYECMLQGGFAAQPDRKKRLTWKPYIRLDI